MKFNEKDILIRSLRIQTSNLTILSLNLKYKAHIRNISQYQKFGIFYHIIQKFSLRIQIKKLSFTKIDSEE